MDVEHYSDAGGFVEAAGDFLAGDVPRQQLLLNVAGTAMDQPDIYPEFHGWIATDARLPVGAVGMTPPHNCIVAHTPIVDAPAVLAAAIHQGGVNVPGATGIVPAIHRFTAEWSRLSGQSLVTEVEHGVFGLEQVTGIHQAEGAMREATQADKSTLVTWWKAFFEEAVPEGAVVGRDIEQKIAARLSPVKPQGISVWEAEEGLVSMSGYSPPVANSIRIGPVYTPPELRGRGFATALVAAQSRWLLDRGYTRCLLYTDLANPTSNSIYKRIGYHQVAESAEVRFVDQTRERAATVTR